MSYLESVSECSREAGCRYLLLDVVFPAFSFERETVQDEGDVHTRGASAPGGLEARRRRDVSARWVARRRPSSAVARRSAQSTSAASAAAAAAAGVQGVCFSGQSCAAADEDVDDGAGIAGHAHVGRRCGETAARYPMSRVHVAIRGRRDRVRRVWCSWPGWGPGGTESRIALLFDDRSCTRP